MRPKKYNEETKMISFRVPVSKVDAIRSLVNNELGSVIVDSKETIEVSVDLKPKWQIDAEERIKRLKL